MQSLRRLLNVRVWLPAAAVILVAGIALSSYYRVGLYDGNEAADTLASQSTQQDTADTTAAPFAGAAGEDGALQAPSDGSRESADKAAQATSTTAAGATMMASPASVMIMTVGDAGDEPDTLIQRMKDLTGLEPLPKDSWVEGRITYAALVATAETAALAEDLGVAVTETLPSAEYAARVPPALAQALGADALTALPLLTPKSGDASSAGLSWLPERDAARRAGDGSDLTIVVITLGAAPLR